MSTERAVVRRAPRLPMSALPATAAAASRATLVELGVRMLSLPVLARRLGVPLRLDAEAPAGTGDRAPLSNRERRRIAAIYRVMRHWPFASGTCLREALLVGHALRHRRPVLRVGVRHGADGPEGHAWVEVQGVAVGDDRRSAVLSERPGG